MSQEQKNPSKQQGQDNSRGNQPDKKNDPSKKDPSKKYMPDGTEEPSREADREANYGPNDPDKKIEIDDNPDETKRKIPNL